MRGRIIALFLAMTCLPLANAADPHIVTLQDAVKQAVVSNPEVQARWHAFQAALYEQDVARGNYLPRADLTTGVGRESLTQPNLPTSTFTRQGAVLSLTQMLFDGFATRNEVARLGYTKLGRYYTLLETSESTALEAFRAYLDVLRYRELSRLAQENFAQHNQVFNRIQQRVQAGVGRRVDFEQAGGRLALAQSNILTEASNLHDVSARYQRIVGTLPPGEMIVPELLKQGIPASVETALKLAYQGSPAFNAAIESVRAAQADAHGRQSNFLPRVDLRARKDLSQNANGIAGRRDEEVIELVLNYNLFKGGADGAQARQYVERLKESQDLRDKACREIRQTLVIAYKDIFNLSRQLGYLDQHRLSIEKAREAYRKQFDIGQRTLLDLLDTENEYFQARRAYVNATFEHAIAHARTLAGMGTLLSALQVSRDGMPTVEELGQDRLNVDADSQCPAEAPFISTGEASEPPSVAEPAPPIFTSPPPVLHVLETPQQALTEWSAAWAAKDFSRYERHYATRFIPENARTREQWTNERRRRLAQPGTITVEISDLKLSVPEASPATTEFTQTYRRGHYRDKVVKRMEWIREDQRWKIQREQVITTLETPRSQAVRPRKAKAAD